MKNYNYKRMKSNKKNIFMITIEPLQMNLISALNKPLGVGMPLNKLTLTNINSFDYNKLSIHLFIYLLQINQ